MLQRHSSRRTPLDLFLADALEGATTYDRIAGYFSSSVLEIAGEAIDRMTGNVRMVCNSDLDPADVATARAAALALRREWNASLPEDFPLPLQTRLVCLYGLLKSGKLQVRVLPNSRFGLIHGKAGVIARQDGTQLAFLGSANESRSAWTRNYEIVWTDDAEESVSWVQEEFDALWRDPAAVPLASVVIEEIERLSRRRVIAHLPEWRDAPEPDPAAPIIELPVYRRENGLWAHQKAFIKRAFDAHRVGGARFVLADQVGLGKTVQLGLAAKLMALSSDKPILILVPRPLLEQWQNELWSLLAFPSARWNGRQWIDENGIAYPDTGVEGLRRCPRRAGIVSTGLIKRQSEGASLLKTLGFECIVVDEAHHARRQNLGEARRDEAAQPNNLLKFLLSIAPRTRSLLLATATPVQLDPIEAWDLLSVLAEGNDSVFGDRYSLWRREPRLALDLIMGRTKWNSAAPTAFWEWIRNPLPLSDEGRDFASLRRTLDAPESSSVVAGGNYTKLRPPDLRRLEDLQTRLFREHNPFIRHIVRRTREYLEKTIDPATGEPYLQPVAVRLHGEGERDALVLPAFLDQAYHHAEEFCREVGRRPGLSSGFLKTLLLRRVGSSIEAGRRTAEKMLRTVEDENEEASEDDTERSSTLYPLEPAERAFLQAFADALKANQDDDPKLYEILRLLESGWLQRGCIIFSQYYDSALWLAEQLSERFGEETIALYAGASRSGILRNGDWAPLSREEIKRQVQTGAIRLMIGTDAASEGLNLQRLGTLINMDLPWNPTRLEQRKGRIQRIGQINAAVDIYNLRYQGSVEDRVHQLLSERFAHIYSLFGQIPDTLEDVWMDVALSDEAEAKRLIDAVPTAHPFELRYDRIESVDWETCATPLAEAPQLDALRQGWTAASG
jgi:superfamily II DNA or RNA helicase